MNEGYQQMSTRRRCDLFRTILSYFIITVFKCRFDWLTSLLCVCMQHELIRNIPCRASNRLENWR